MQFFGHHSAPNNPKNCSTNFAILLHILTIFVVFIYIEAIPTLPTIQDSLRHKQTN